MSTPPRDLAGLGALVAGALLGIVGVARWSLARRSLAAGGAPAPGAPSAEDVDVLVPVRSGDPLLPQRLAASVATAGPARVHLLVDDDDPPARRAADALAGPTVVVHRFPAPTPGRNPKVEKLALAIERLAARGDLREVVVQLDDDTSLPPGGMTGLLAGLATGRLATAIPVYLEQGGPWSRLVAAFVNGSALVTYLPLARLAPPVSINGMALAMRSRDLEAIGGYPAIWSATCDDYALARAFRRRGMTIVQTAQPVLLATSVDGPCAYVRLVRRWLLFAGQVFRHDPSVRLVLVAGLPGLAPLTALVLAAASRRRTVLLPAAVGVVVATQAGTWWLRRDLWRRSIGPTLGSRGAPSLRGLVEEVLAAVVTPVHLAGTVGRRTVTWRGRRVRVGIGE